MPHPPTPRADAGGSADRLSTILEADGAVWEIPSRDAASKDTTTPTADAPVRDTGSESASGGDASAPRVDTARPRDAAVEQPATETRDGFPPDAEADADDVAADVADASADVPGRPPGPGDLRITELLINPAGTDTNREWIEVVNLSDATVDLHSLTVADAASEVAVDAGLLAPGAILVLGQSLDPARNGGAPVAVSVGNVISLNNGGDLIRLCLGPCAGGVVIAEVSWAANLGPAFDGHAAVVGTGPGPSDSGGEVDGAGAIVFCPADQPFGTAGSFGRPGLPDPPCPG